MISNRVRKGLVNLIACSPSLRYSLRQTRLRTRHVSVTFNQIPGFTPQNEKRWTKAPFIHRPPPVKVLKPNSRTTHYAILSRFTFHASFCRYPVPTISLIHSPA